MTEAEWQMGRDWRAMLSFLRGSGKASDRKLRLFAVACCRQIWPLIKDERSRLAIEVSEQHADARASEIELEAATSEARAACLLSRHPASGVAVGTRPWREAHLARHVAAAAWYTAYSPEYACYAAGLADAVARQRGLAWSGDGRHWQARLLQCIFGPQPVPALTANSDRLTRQGNVVRQYAQIIYENRSFERLPELATALEEAGCRDGVLLGHLRSEGPHVRGCFAVDAVLGLK